MAYVHPFICVYDKQKRICAMSVKEEELLWLRHNWESETEAICIEIEPYDKVVTLAPRERWET